jgi:hypothetical protein
MFCLSKHIIDEAMEEEHVASLASGLSRPGVRCLKTVDIGMDTTCPGRSFYCWEAKMS